MMASRASLCVRFVFSPSHPFRLTYWLISNELVKCLSDLEDKSAPVPALKIRLRACETVGLLTMIVVCIFHGDILDGIVPTYETASNPPLGVVNIERVVPTDRPD